MLLKKSNGDIVNASVCPSVHPSIHPSVHHAISSLTTGRNCTSYISPPIVRVCESSIIFLCVHLSVHLSSVHLSVVLSPPEPLGRIQPNLLHHLSPHIVRVCESNIIFLCIYPSVHLSSIHLSFRMRSRSSIPSRASSSLDLVVTMS